MLLAGAGFLAYAWESPIAPLEAQAAATADPVLVARGAELAAIGNCITCHTAPGGRPFAGGRALETPFGTIHATNITPDRETGIGAWSEEAFNRSMREGVDREGNHLYPAFPYDHFTRVTDEDNRALHAYLMTVPAVQAEAPANDLPFPLDQRILVAGWKLLFFRPGAHQPDPALPPEVDRGLYLAEGLGHCGSCHTPRNSLGAEIADAHWDGAELDGWHAYAINEKSPAPLPWTREKMAFYLAHGFEAEHGVSRGSMAPVTTNLGAAASEDVEALAAYVIHRMGEPSAERQAAAQASREAAGISAETTAALAPTGDSQTAPATSSEEGRAIYQAACASCHEAGRPVPYGGLNLHLSTAANAPSPQNLINVTLWGLPAPEGAGGAVMPGFEGALGAAQMTALLSFLRAEFSQNKEPWPDLAQRVEDTMSGRTPVSLYRSDGASAAPSDPAARTGPWQ